jgi:catalase
MILDRNVDNFFAENEQIAFGTGVLVDGLDFSDDKMLLGRTFSYSDTQRYRIGANYLQLPVNRPKKATVATNQRDGRMTYAVDGNEAGENRHVNYEPSSHPGAIREARHPVPIEQGPVISGRLTRQRIPRTNDYAQVGDRYRTMLQWERDDLVRNLIALLATCERYTQERMVWHLLLADPDYGMKVGAGLGLTVSDVKGLAPLTGQALTEDDMRRVADLGAAKPRVAAGAKPTGSVEVLRLADVPDSLASRLVSGGASASPDARIGPLEEGALVRR